VPIGKALERLSIMYKREDFRPSQHGYWDPCWAVYPPASGKKLAPDLPLRGIAWPSIRLKEKGKETNQLNMVTFTW
jgi:hypothetical protein